MPTFGPIQDEPRRLRPPYTEIDHNLSQQWWESTEEWRSRWHGERMAALLEPLADLDISAYECHILEWFAAGEDSTCAVISALLHRARAAKPLAAGGHEPMAGGR